MLPTLPISAPAKPRPAKPRSAKPSVTKPLVTSPLPKKPVAATRPGGAGTWSRARYFGVAGSREYFVYRPLGLRRTTAVPLVMLLHGCTQSPAEFAAATRFNQLADRQGFLLVYPHQTVTHNLQRCWNWFEPRHQERTGGEPHVLAGIVEQVAADQTSWRIDRSRVYVAGISAGGGMALILGATYPDVFAGVGVHSGPAYRSAGSGAIALAAMSGRTPLPDLAGDPGQGALPPTIVFQGTGDFTVRAGNGSRIAEQWLECRAANTGPSDPDRITRSRVSRPTTGRRTSTVTRWYSARGRTCLETWLVNGLGHAWSGGLAKGSFSDPLGPRATTNMWRFLSAQRLGN